MTPSQFDLIEDAMQGVRVVLCTDCNGLGETLEGTCERCGGCGETTTNELETRHERD